MTFFVVLKVSHGPCMVLKGLSPTIFELDLARSFLSFTYCLSYSSFMYVFENLYNSLALGLTWTFLDSTTGFPFSPISGCGFSPLNSVMCLNGSLQTVFQPEASLNYGYSFGIPAIRSKFFLFSNLG